MDYLITPDINGVFQMTFEAVFDCRNNILLSLHIKKGSLFVDKNFGSDLYKIKENRSTDLRLAESYARDALQWMLKITRLKSVDVLASAINDGIELKITATSAIGNIIPYTYYLRVK